MFTGIDHLTPAVWQLY